MNHQLKGRDEILAGLIQEELNFHVLRSTNFLILFGVSLNANDTKLSSQSRSLDFSGVLSPVIRDFRHVRILQLHFFLLTFA